MSRYQSYLDCKESCLPLIGRIPTHWVLTKLKFIGVLKGGAGFPHEEQGNTSESIDFHKVNALAKANDEGFIEKSENTVSRETAKRLGAFVFPKKSIVFAKVGAALLLSRIRMLKDSACIDNNLMGFVVHRQYDVDFIKYAMELIRFDLLVNPGAIPSLNENQIGNYFLVVPTYAEQRKIANFLDHETAKIDTLIAKQQELIKLLKEKRQAVISHAVTKGLNPNAPMRDSGVEWLGEVPAHWTVLQIRHVLNSMEQGKSPECESRPADADADEWGVLKTSCVNQAKYHSGENKVLPNYIAPFVQYEVKPGDLLMSRASGSLDLIGSVAYVYETPPRILLSDKIFRLEIAETVSRIFFSYLMQSSYIRSLIKISISGAEGMANNITKTSVLSFRFAMPPANEQVEIELHLEGKIRQLDLLLEKTENTIGILQERRTALISAAVTGKIDVRDWQPPSESAVAA